MKYVFRILLFPLVALTVGYFVCHLVLVMFKSVQEAGDWWGVQLAKLDDLIERLNA